MNTSSVAITAGLGGFLVLFGLGLAIWFLGRDMSRRLRGIRLRDEAEQARRAASSTPSPTPGQSIASQSTTGPDAATPTSAAEDESAAADGGRPPQEPDPR